jgi:branched-chain amino acid transport system permease protein
MTLDTHRLLEQLRKKKVTLAIIALLFVFPLASPSRYYVTLLSEMCLLALLAASYDLMLGYTGLVNFGHAAFFGIGAYTSAILLNMGLPFLLAVLAAVSLGALVGLAMGAFTLRVSGIYYALVTLAFAEMIYAVLSRWVDVSGGETGISVFRPGFLRSEWGVYFGLAISFAVVVALYVAVGRDLVRKSTAVKTKILYAASLIGFAALMIYVFPAKWQSIIEGVRTDITVMNVYYILALLPMVASYFVLRRLVRSPLGRIFIAVRENEERAKMLGYNAFQYRLVSSIIAGLFAGLAGALYAPLKLSISPYSVLASTVTINVLLYSILGGLGTLVGPIFGAGVITLLADTLPGIPYIGEYWMLTLGGFYLVVILFLPYGIVNTWRYKGASAKKRFSELVTWIKKSGRRETTL